MFLQKLLKGLIKLCWRQSSKHQPHKYILVVSFFTNSQVAYNSRPKNPYNKRSVRLRSWFALNSLWMRSLWMWLQVNVMAVMASETYQKGITYKLPVKASKRLAVICQNWRKARSDDTPKNVARIDKATEQTGIKSFKAVSTSKEKVSSSRRTVFFSVGVAAVPSISTVYLTKQGKSR